MTVSIWPGGSQVATGYPGAETNPIGARTATVTTANATTLLPPGWYIVVNGAHNTVTMTYSSGNSDTLIAASAAGIVFSDGENVQIVNDSTGSAAHYYALAGGGP